MQESEKKFHFVIYKTEEEKIKTIIENTILMMSNRIYIGNNGEKLPLLSFKKTLESVADLGDNVYTFKADNGTEYALKIVFQKISNTGKQSVINDFFKDYDKYSKIVVATGFNNKISQYATKNSAQIFTEASMLLDILSWYGQPKFEVMSPSEIERLKMEYNVSDYSLKKMLRTDPMAKYFGLKKGAVLRIERDSPVSGKNVDYRVVS